MAEWHIDKEELIAWRRYLHMHPELSGKEEKTAAYLKEQLWKMGITEIREQVFGYGMVATIPGDPRKKCAALRTEMDALPITEENEAPYRSQNPGVMHACGHDAHMAIVLGAAKALTENPPDGTVKIFFQPREEKPPGGACYMVEKGVMENPHVDGVFGLHISPLFPAGVIGLREGSMMAIADDFALTITGRGGHGSSPHTAIDPVVMTSEAVMQIQALVSRMNNSQEPLVISICTIHGGTAQNIIPDEVKMTGTLRCLSAETRDGALAKMHQVLKGVAESWGGSYQLDYLYGYPSVISTPEMVSLLQDVIRDIPGVMAHKMPYSLLAGEDFAYFAQKAPAVYFMLGSLPENRSPYAWHHPMFDIDEAALPIGSRVLAECAFRLAAQPKE